MSIISSVMDATEAVNSVTLVLARLAGVLTVIAERKCARCKGTGKRLTALDTGPCPGCNGRGY